MIIEELVEVEVELQAFINAHWEAVVLKNAHDLVEL